MDRKASQLYSGDQKSGLVNITEFSVNAGDQLVKDWKSFYQYLFMKYMDGNVKQTEGFQLLDNGNGKGVPKKPSQPGYGREWERVMVQGTGDRLKVPETK